MQRNYSPRCTIAAEDKENIADNNTLTGISVSVLYIRILLFTNGKLFERSCNKVSGAFPQAC